MVILLNHFFAIFEVSRPAVFDTETPSLQSNLTTYEWPGSFFPYIRA